MIFACKNTPFLIPISFWYFVIPKRLRVIFPRIIRPQSKDEDVSPFSIRKSGELQMILYYQLMPEPAPSCRFAVLLRFRRMCDFTFELKERLTWAMYFYRSAVLFLCGGWDWGSEINFLYVLRYGILKMTLKKFIL